MEAMEVIQSLEVVAVRWKSVEVIQSVELIESVQNVNQRVPRLRITHLAFALLANAMGDQECHIWRQATLLGKDCERIYECDIWLLAGELRWLTGVLWPTQWSHLGFWLLYSKHDAIAIHTVLHPLHLSLVRRLSWAHHSASLPRLSRKTWARDCDSDKRPRLRL